MKKSYLTHVCSEDEGGAWNKEQKQGNTLV